MDIAGWLRSLGLEQYEPAFRENHVDETVLPNLTVEDLKDLDVGSIGHRRKLLEAIALLRAAADAKAPPPAPTIEAARDRTTCERKRYFLTSWRSGWRTPLSHGDGRPSCEETR